jgi:hypothetical protein
MITPENIPQGSLVTPKEPIKIGRALAHPGQTFWVTDSSITRAQRGTISLARSGRSSGYAQLYSFADFTRFFAAVSDFSDHGQAVENAMLQNHPNTI